MPANVSIPTATAAETLAWLENFSAVLTGAPGTYGVTAPEAATLDGLVVNFRTAYDTAGVVGRVAVNPGGYTQPNRAAMYAASDAALGMARPMAVTIQANDGISDMDKLTAGVQPRNFNRNPILVPATAPLLNVQFATPLVHTLSYADTPTPDSKAKPFGAIQLQLFRAIDTVIVTDPAAMDYYVAATVNPILVSADAPDAGKIASYVGRWVGRRGDVGPWSAVAHMTIAQ